MLAHMLRFPVGTSSKRAYSFFSFKPGGGRYFNSAKPHKVAPSSATAASTRKPKAKPDDGSPSTQPPSSSPPDDVPVKNFDKEGETPVAAQQPAFISRPTAPPLPPHPTFCSHTYPLHLFFSLHRPLLLLPLATSKLFESPSTTFDDAMSSSSPDATDLQLDDSAEASSDADADAARQLARALALNRVGGWIDWEETLARLGDAESLRVLESWMPVDSLNTDISLDSTRRKKRKKMSKHKYKKRRRLQRAERRKMGK